MPGDKFLERLAQSRQEAIQEQLLKSQLSLNAVEKRFDTLFPAIIDKICNRNLERSHTQLSYLPKEEQELHRNIVKTILLQKINGLLLQL